MLNIGAIVNGITILVGSFLGFFVGKRLTERLKEVLFEAIGVTTIIIGVKMSLDAKYLIIVLVSLAIGGVFGEAGEIEKKLDAFADILRHFFMIEGRDRFVKGFVTALVLFVVGPMTILGCIQSGISSSSELLLLKSMMDGISSIILASAYGKGVVFSAVAVYVIEGFLIQIASLIKFIGVKPYINDFSGVGGLIVILIGIRLLHIKEIKVGNFLPALLVVIFLDWITLSLS